jgi:hypothetical protein
MHWAVIVVLHLLQANLTGCLAVLLAHRIIWLRFASLHSCVGLHILFALVCCLAVFCSGGVGWLWAAYYCDCWKVHSMAQGAAYSGMHRIEAKNYLHMYLLAAVALQLAVSLYGCALLYSVVQGCCCVLGELRCRSRVAWWGPARAACWRGTVRHHTLSVQGCCSTIDCFIL